MSSGRDRHRACSEDELTVLQTVTVVGSASCVTWANAMTLITEPALIPRISLIRLREHLIRRSRRTVQDRPSRTVRWADIPELSTCVGCCPAAWQQSRRHGDSLRLSAIQAVHNSSRHKIYVRLVLSPVAAVCRWSLLLPSPLLSAQPRSSGAKLTRTAGPLGPGTGSGAAELRITSVSRALLAGFKARPSFRITGCCWWRPLAVGGRSGATLVMRRPGPADRGPGAPPLSPSDLLMTGYGVG
jgi:hypothetical protein